MRQLSLIHVKRAVRADILRYVQANAERYTHFARAIAPDLNDGDQVRTRVAFAILSANTTFEQAVRALGYCHGTGWNPDPFILAGMGLYPAKAGYVRGIAEKHGELIHGPESWDAYRNRLRAAVSGLGLAKASFAVCLLYPLDANVACLDTWMQKVILGHKRFHTLSSHKYRRCEQWVRRIARAHGVSTFIAQWLIWDSARGETNNHDIFPGRHKGTEWMLGGE